MPASSDIPANPSTPCLNIMVALSCEAKPLIDFYRLSKQASGAYPHFHKPPQHARPYAINLVVSGIGIVNMAAACGWIGAHTGTQRSAWLNIGTAGHASLAVGEIVQVQRSMQLNAERAYYPPRVAKWAGEGVSLLSYNAPCTAYPAAQAVDMEASALFAIATRFTSAELVQSLKVISDNEKNGIENLNARRISELVAPHVTQINNFANALVALLPSEAVRTDSLRLIDALHCTHSQRQQYLDLFSKLENVGQPVERLSKLVESADSMRAVLQKLLQLQQTTAPTLPGKTVKRATKKSASVATSVDLDESSQANSL